MVVVNPVLCLPLEAVVIFLPHSPAIPPPLQLKQHAGLAYDVKLRSLPRLISETLKARPAHILRSYAENLIIPIPRLTLTGPSRECSRLLSLALQTPVQASASRSGPLAEQLVLVTSDPVPPRLHGHRPARLLQLGLRDGTGLLSVPLVLL